jgi:hypothetical protein
MTNYFTGSVKKVAPTLYRIHGLEWAWVRLSDVAEICNADTQMLWQSFCIDATERRSEYRWDCPERDTQPANGTGSLYAEPSSRDDAVYEVKTAVDHSTGVFSNPPDLDFVLVPAGWSKKNIFGKAQVFRKLCLTLLDEENALSDHALHLYHLLNGIAYPRLKAIISLLMSEPSEVTLACSPWASGNRVTVCVQNDVTTVACEFVVSAGVLRLQDSLKRYPRTPTEK